MSQSFPRQVDTGFGITTQGPRRLLGHEDESWFCRTEVVHDALRGLYELFERLPGYVRPFTEIGATGRIRPDGWLPLESLAPSCSLRTLGTRSRLIGCAEESY